MALDPNTGFEEDYPQGPYMKLTGMAPSDGPADAPPPQPVYAPMLQPQQPGYSTMERPATNPEELASRKAGWQEVLSNPNFKQALMFAGLSLMQPKPIGQTNMGMLGNALATGATAFNLGEYGDWERGMKEREESRKEAESKANVAGTQASTANTQASTDTKRAALPGVSADASRKQTEAKIAESTAEDHIAQAKTARQQAEFNLSKAKSEDEVASVERDLKKRRLEIEKGIPDEAIRKAALAEVDAASLKAEEARARLNASKATAGLHDATAEKTRAEAGQQQITYETLKKMDSAERKEFLTKTGRYTQHTSGVGQQAIMWGSIYDKLPDTDPAKKGKTREQFQMEQLKSAKTSDVTTQMKNYLQSMTNANLDPDPEVLSHFSELIKSSLGSRAGKPAGSAAKPVPGGATPEEWERGPDGKLRRKVQAQPAK